MSSCRAESFRILPGPSLSVNGPVYAPQHQLAGGSYNSTNQIHLIAQPLAGNQASYTPVQVFLPPMYSAPLGAVSLPDTTDEGLLHYFMTVASKTWSALDSFGEHVVEKAWSEETDVPLGSPSSAMLLPSPVDTASSTCGQSLHGALLHAMLCASATHSHNLSRSISSGPTNYGQQAKKHRVESFRLLNASVSGLGEGSGELLSRSHAESRVATVMLLILSSVSHRRE